MICINIHGGSMNDLDLVIIEKIRRDRQAEEETKRVHLELPVYDNYYANKNTRKEKESKRVIIIDL
tara:strand:- start:30 stop:227 length:198 start_codon:yes stop_codon:yes gene_type:complete